MSAAISSFEDLEDGQDLALTTNGIRTKWTWSGGYMVNENQRMVEPFFFSGALASGRLVPANFAPPEVREWFRMDTRPYKYYLVVDTKGDGMADSPYVAVFVSADFSGFTQINDIIETHYRSDPPEWGNSTLERLAVSAYGEHKARREMQDKIQQIRDAQHYLRYSRDYLNNAITSLERT